MEKDQSTAVIQKRQPCGGYFQHEDNISHLIHQFWNLPCICINEPSSRTWLVSPLCCTTADRIRSQIRCDAVKGKAGVGGGSERLFWIFHYVIWHADAFSFQSLEFSRDQGSFQVQERSRVWISGPCNGGRIDSKRGWLSYHFSYLTRLMQFFLTSSFKKGGKWFNLIYAWCLIVSPAF